MSRETSDTTGNRFTALQPIAQGLKAEFGATGADTGRGLALRMDHGTQYTADNFLNQIKFWGIAPSFAFVAQPQTNGVAERFDRTFRSTDASSRTSKRSAPPSRNSRIATIVIGA